MNKQKYLAELVGLLSFLSEEDRALVIDHFTKRFDAAGAAGAAALILELGTPMQLAIRLNHDGIESIRVSIDSAPAAPDMPETEALAEAKVETEVETETEAEVEAETETETETEPEPEVEAEVETISEIISELHEPAPTPEPDEPGPEIELIELESAVEPEPISSAELIQEVLREPEPEPVPMPVRIETFPELDVVRGIADNESAPETKKSVGGSIVFYLIMIVIGLPLFVGCVALAVGLLLPGLIVGATGIVGIGAGMATLAYVPDAMYVFGSTLVLLGLALLLFVLGVWLIRQLCALWRFSVGGLYRRLVRKEAAK